MKNYKQSRGWRNNNPLNIRRGERWQGLTPTQRDSSFCQFTAMEWGYRAAAKIMKSYYRLFVQQGRKFTVRNIVSRWAPEKENLTEAYIRRVSKLLLGDEYSSVSYIPEIELGRPDTPQGARHIGQLMAAMTCVECGCAPSQVDYPSIRSGLGLAFNIYPSIESFRL